LREVQIDAPHVLASKRLESGCEKLATRGVGRLTWPVCHRSASTGPGTEETVKTLYRPLPTRDSTSIVLYWVPLQWVVEKSSQSV
jgi:hypothetical protein